MKGFLTFLLFGTFFSSFSQQESKVFKDDFDKDGLPEELIIHYFLGKPEKAILKYELGNAECVFDFYPNTAQPSLIQVVPICSDLLQPKYKALMEAVDSLIFPFPKKTELDPNLSWLKENYNSKIEISDDPVVKSISKFNPAWIKGKYSEATNQRFLLNGKTANQFNSIHKKNDSTNTSWVLFDAEPLGTAKQIEQLSLEAKYPIMLDSIQIDSNNYGSINKTGHSVFLETDSSHKVIFVSDGVLFSNMQKLKWESIQQVQEKFGYIFVLTFPYPAIENKLFVIDYKNGKMIELQKELLYDSKKGLVNISSFELIESELYLFLKKRPSSAEIIEKRVDLTPILNALKN